MEKEKSFTGPLKKKKNGLRCRTTISLGAKMRRVVLDRGISGRREERKHEQPVAVQCPVICLYSAVSGCATCWKPPYSTPDYTFAEIRTKYYAATWIRYRRTNLSLWQKRGISITLSLALLPFLLPCITRGGRSLHTSWNETILATGTRFCRDSKIPGG